MPGSAEERLRELASTWIDLDSLVRDDLTVTAVEFSRYGSYYMVTIRRNRPVHSIGGTGSTPAEAMREARRLYSEDRAESAQEAR